MYLWINKNIKCLDKSPMHNSIYLKYMFIFPWFHLLFEDFYFNLFYFILFYFILFFVFLGLHLQHMEVHRLGVKLELELLAYTIATATRDPSCICDLYQSSQQVRPRIEPESSWRLVRFSTIESLQGLLFFCFLFFRVYWIVVDLQCYENFCCTRKCFISTCTHIHIAYHRIFSGVPCAIQ